MADRDVLVYKDLVLRESDLSILREPCYLNDQIIGFYFSYLHSLFNSADILFVQPSVSFWLTNAQEPENVKHLLEPLNLPDKNLIFFPINDCDNLEGGDNGNHWSLLVFDRDMYQFVHHDSMEGVNSFHATKLYDAVKAFVGSAGPSSSLSVKPSKLQGQGKQNKQNKQKALQQASRLSPPTISCSCSCSSPSSSACGNANSVPGFKECSSTPLCNGNCQGNLPVAHQ